MEARFVCLLLVVLCVVNVGAESFKGRALSYFPVWPCRRACKAVNRTDPEVLRKMIANDRDLCGCVCNTATGAGLLHTAVESKCTLCVDLLTSDPINCSCNDLDYHNNTALHTAAGQCRMEMTDSLLSAGCNVALKNAMDDTALCVASRTDDEECGGIVRSLMGAGADPCVGCNNTASAIGGCVNQVVCDIMGQDIEDECEEDLSPSQSASPIFP